MLFCPEGMGMPQYPLNKFSTFKTIGGVKKKKKKSQGERERFTINNTP